MGYYTGDPGFLSAFGRLAGIGASFIPGVGPVVGRAVSAASQIGGRIGRAVARHPTISAVGSAAASGAAGAGVERMMARPAVMPGGAMQRGGFAPGITARGFHMSKPYKCHGVIVPSHPVRNRHMRATNPRALRRAIRRAKGFERLARKVMHFVSPRAHKGRAVFRTRRRSK